MPPERDMWFTGDPAREIEPISTNRRYRRRELARHDELQEKIYGEGGKWAKNARRGEKYEQRRMTHARTAREGPRVGENPFQYQDRWNAEAREFDRAKAKYEKTYSRLRDLQHEQERIIDDWQGGMKTYALNRYYDKTGQGRGYKRGRYE